MYKMLHNQKQTDILVLAFSCEKAPSELNLPHTACNKHTQAKTSTLIVELRSKWTKTKLLRGSYHICTHLHLKPSLSPIWNKWKVKKVKRFLVSWLMFALSSQPDGDSSCTNCQNIMSYNKFNKSLNIPSNPFLWSGSGFWEQAVISCCGSARGNDLHHLPFVCTLTDI